MNLLIVDDEPLIHVSLEYNLKEIRSEDVTIYHAYTGAEMLSLMETTLFDLVLVDIQLPGINGLTAIEKAQELYPQTLFYIMTSFSEFEYAQKAVRLKVTDYLLTMQQNVLDKLKETDRHSRDVAVMPMMPQFRTTAHIKGDYSLKVADAYRHFEDSVCAINDFEHRDHLFEVPLRTLCRRDYPNILAAGRCADGTGYGWDLLRVIPPAILTGQAAAHAACLALKTGVGAPAVDIRSLQTVLGNDNIMVHFPDSYLPEDRTVVIHGKNAAEIEGGHM